MSLPVLVEVVRGDLTESCHTGSIAIAHADGGLMFTAGASGAQVFPRSAVKLFQALPLVESGAASRFGFSDYELALACASHTAEPRHLEAVAGMLGRIGLTREALACGPHWPWDPERVAKMGAAGETPGALHNTCSGKHAGMLAFAVHAGIDPDGYEKPDHPVQQAVRAGMAEAFGADMDEAPCGIDGCSLPTLAVPLVQIARGFARMMGEAGIAVERRAAADRLMAACMKEPHAVGGEGRFDTEAMRAFSGRVFIKHGAEGVHVVAFPRLRIAAAVKIADGATRASEVVAAALISRFVLESATDHACIETWLRPVLRNAAGAEVGYLRPAPTLIKSLMTL